MKILRKDFKFFINKITGPFLHKTKRSVSEPKLLPDISVSGLQDDLFQKAEGIKEIVIKHFNFETKFPVERTVTKNPSDKAVLYRKVLNPLNGEHEIKPFNVDVGMSKQGYITMYHFLEEKTQRELGYVAIEDWRAAKDNTIYNVLYSSSPIKQDIPELGLVGDRISIGSLQNNFENEISGIGLAGDQIALEYCIKEGLRPNITSVAFSNSHAAHYLRGRRFFDVAKFDTEIAENFKKTYGTTNPNIVIRNRIKETPAGQKTETSDIGSLYMYMPQHVVQKYLQKIKEKPFLH